MNSFKLILSILLSIQFTTVKSYAIDEEVICNHCVDENAKPRDVVEVDGRNWVIEGLGSVNGVPMWQAHPLRGEALGHVEGSVYGRGEITGNPRLTGKNLSSYEDNPNLSREEREKIGEIQQKIIARLNAESTADSESTTTELSKQMESLHQAVVLAGEVAYQGPSVPTEFSDPLAALYNSLEVQLGAGNFSMEQAGWQLFDDHEYQSDHKEELTQLRHRLNDVIPKTPQQADAKRSGYFVLSETDKAFLVHDGVLGASLLKIASPLVDIATDVIPLTAIPKDFYRIIVGKDPLTGEILNHWERAIAGGFLVAGIITLGASNLVAPEARALAKAGRLAEEEIELGVRIGKEGPQSAANYQRYLKQLREQMERPVVNDERLKEFLEDYWRQDAKVGNGSTASAIRYELKTGKPVGEKWHTNKGQEALVFFSNWLKNNSTASASDRRVVENLILDLMDSLEGSL
ncbi:MAG: pre-toxin TG domain-containing protein [Pseudobdellovibrionaceae bacterium]